MLTCKGFTNLIFIKIIFQGVFIKILSETVRARAPKTHKQGEEQREKQAPHLAQSTTQGLSPGPWILT